MKKNLLRLTYILLSVTILASAAGCGLSGFKVTGKIEDGTLTVWYSPRYSELWQKGIYSDNAYLFTDFPDETNGVYFTTQEEFTTSLSQALTSGDGPDLVLAYADEISPKMLDSKMFVDLDPFLDYEDKQTSSYDLNKNGENIGSNTEVSSTIIKREDLIMNLVDIGRYKGKLYFMPFGLGIKSLQGNEEDLKYGCVDLYNNDYTPAKFLEAIKKVKPAEIGGERYPEFTSLPEPEFIFKNFIDYENKTTRMDEDITYDYYCAYVQSLIDQRKRVIAWSGNHSTKIDGRTTVLNFSSESSVFSSFYTMNISPMWEGFTAPNNGDSVLGAGFSKQEALLRSDAVQPKLPSEYGTKYYISMSDTAVAAIPASSKRPNKAFAFIKALLSEAYCNSGIYRISSPNIHVFKSRLADLKLSQKQIDKVFADIKNGEYAFVRTDSKIDEMFHDLLYDKMSQSDVLRTTIPTREEWNALKEKIELYLNE